MVNLIDAAKAELRSNGPTDWFARLPAAQQAEVRAAIQLVITGELTASALSRAIIKQYGLQKTQNHVNMTIRNLIHERTGESGKNGKANRGHRKASTKANRRS